MTTGDVPADRRRGRPEKTTTDRRSERICFRVRPDELAEVQQLAASSNLPLSEFARERTMSGEVVVRQFNALSAVDRHALARIGANLNQLARAFNTTGDLSRAREIKAVLDELHRLLDSIEAVVWRPDELRQG